MFWSLRDDKTMINLGNSIIEEKNTVFDFVLPFSILNLKLKYILDILILSIS